jgi:hypothetical protein
MAQRWLQEGWTTRALLFAVVGHKNDARVAQTLPQVIQRMVQKNDARLAATCPKMAPASLDKSILIVWNCWPPIDDPQAAQTWPHMIHSGPTVTTIWPQHSPNVTAESLDNKTFIVWNCWPQKIPSNGLQNDTK